MFRFLLSTLYGYGKYAHTCFYSLSLVMVSKCASRLYRFYRCHCFHHLCMVMVSIGVSLLSACDVHPITARVNSADAEASSNLFKKHVYPLFEEMNCSSCHHADGAAKGHPFADEDIDVAYQSAKTKVDFNDIENSLFVTRQKEGRHNCGSQCDDNAKQLIAALTEWQEGADSAVDDWRFTDEKDADQDETGDDSDYKLKFSINNLLADNTAGSVILSVTVIKISTDNSNLLILEDFAISTTDKPIYIGGLRAKRNGKLHSDKSKDRVCALVEPSDEDAILKQYGEITFSLESDDTSTNKIAFGLLNFRVAKEHDECEDNDNSEIAQAKTAFDDKSENSVGKIISDNCLSSCHTSSTQGTDISTFDNFYAARQEIKRRVACDNVTPNQRATWCMPQGISGNWSSGQRNDAQKQTLLDWLNNLTE